MAAETRAEKVERRLSPWKLGGLTVSDLGRRVYREAWEDEVTDRAAALSYYFLFALFPALLFLTSLLGLLPIPNLMDRLMGYVQEALPPDAASLIQKTLAEIKSGAHGGLLSIGALTALWAASNGMGSLMTTLNVAYDIEDTRSWWRRRLVAIALTAGFSVLILLAMLLLVFGGTIGGAVGQLIGLGDLAVKIWNIVQWPVAVFFIVLGIALVYYAAPAVEHRKWYWVTPGSLVATVAWLVMSVALRFYVSHFANYSATYGSIGGVILLMLWLYLTGVVILVGAEVNSEIEHAAAERGAPTAKAKGEQAPGVPGPPPRAVSAHTEGAQGADERLDGPAVGLPGRGPFARPASERVADAAVGAVYLARALPWIGAWAGLRVVAGTTGVLARHRTHRRDGLARAEEAAASVARARLEHARAAARAHADTPRMRRAG